MYITDFFEVESFYQGMTEPEGYGAFDEEPESEGLEFDLKILEELESNNL